MIPRAYLRVSPRRLKLLLERGPEDPLWPKRHSVLSLSVLPVRTWDELLSLFRRDPNAVFKTLCYNILIFNADVKPRKSWVEFCMKLR